MGKKKTDPEIWNRREQGWEKLMERNNQILDEEAQDSDREKQRQQQQYDTQLDELDGQQQGDGMGLETSTQQRGVEKLVSKDPLQEKQGYDHFEDPLQQLHHFAYYVSSLGDSEFDSLMHTLDKIDVQTQDGADEKKNLIVQMLDDILRISDTTQRLVLKIKEVL